MDDHSSAHASTQGMRRFWDEAAHRNAAYYVDTSLSYADPDMNAFWETGRRIVDEAIGPAAVKHPERRDLAVEIGSGLGRNCKALRETFASVVGIDISPEMVRQATEMAGDGIEFRLGSGASLSGVQDRSVDFVLSFTVFQHIPDPAVIEAYIEEAGRVLARGGVFAFQWNNTPGARRWRVRRAALSLLQRIGFGDPHGRNASQFLGSVMTLTKIEAALERGGLRLDGTKGEGTLFCWAWASRAS
jgi:SAM-dependent methyltransferase